MTPCPENVDIVSWYPGVAAIDGAEAGPSPERFVALVVNVWAVPLVRPVMVHVSGPVDHEHWSPPGFEVTVYPVIVAPPFDAGASHETLLCPFPPLVAETLSGGSGVV